MTTYIIGHQKPDTDAVVSALALEYLYKQKDSFGYKNPQAVIADPLNPETSFLFKKFNSKIPNQISSKDIKSTDQVVLVDHNEDSQRLPNLDPTLITEVIDHHKINLDLAGPIFTTFKPWGSTTTIVYFLMKQKSLTPPKPLASLMLSAILSDTVGFKSSTTTEKDKRFGQELAKIANISDVEKLTLEIFKAKSDVSKLTSEQIVKNDYKFFDFGKKVFIDQLETVQQDQVVRENKSDLLQAMKKIKEAEKIDLLFVAVTDILKVNTKLIILSDQESQVAEKAFGGKTKSNILDIGPMLSRKKEIAPAIEQALR